METSCFCKIKGARITFWRPPLRHTCILKPEVTQIVPYWPYGGASGLEGKVMEGE
jgi:hypothetical protein